MGIENLAIPPPPPSTRDDDPDDGEEDVDDYEEESDNKHGRKSDKGSVKGIIISADMGEVSGTRGSHGRSRTEGLISGMMADNGQETKRDVTD
jgi:hypothetical protein